MLVMDTVALASELVIKNQLIGVASSAQGFGDVDGVLGIASVDLTTVPSRLVSQAPPLQASSLPRVRSPMTYSASRMSPLRPIQMRAPSTANSRLAALTA